MSYTIILRVLPDGGVECEPGYGIPAGEFEIEGSDDGIRVSVSIRQRDERGRFVVSAHHQRDRAEEALHEAEEVASAVEAAVTEAVAEAAARAEAAEG